MPLLRRRDNTLARELFFPRLHTSKNACQVAFNVLREMQRSFAMFFVLRGMFPIATWCMNKTVWKTPSAPSSASPARLLQEPDVLLHRVAVKLWSQGAMFHAVPG